jgi:adenine-specific DNA-methyltransferase
MAEPSKRSKLKELKSLVQKMDGNSYNPQAELLELLKSKCPEAFTEGKIDPKKLRQTLGEEVSEEGERYGLSWAGKSDCFRHIQEPTTATLKPIKKESIDFDKTENIFIEGDNLEVLKALQKSYYGSIKMIYIDPPYNTGNDSFIYPDRYKEEKEDYELRAGIKDAEGLLTKDGFWRKNSKDAGHFHSNWLSMMYPRLFLAKNLLREDGVIFVSIDDNEVQNLRMIMNEVFDEENILAELVWDLGSGTAAGHFTRAHEYILVYARDKSSLSNFVYQGETDLISERAVKKISRGNPASCITFPPEIEFEGDSAVFEGIIGNSEKIRIVDGKFEFKNGKLVSSVTLEAGWAMRDQILSWLNGEETYDTKGQKVKRFYFSKKGVLQYEKERGFVNPPSVLRGIASTKKGSEEIEELFGKDVIDFPKPTDLLKYLIELVCNDGDTVIDFFAGACCTAHAAMRIHHEINRHVRHISVQLAEPCNETTDSGKNALSLGFKTIAEISKERIRRAAKKIKEETKGKLDFDGKKLDLGFKVFKLSESNFKQWRENIKTGEELKEQMKMFVDNTKKESRPEDMLYEIILKNSRFDLNVKISKESFDGVDYYRLVDGVEIICLAPKITKKSVDKIISLKPEKFTCLDTAFKNNDQLKTNTALQMEAEKIEFKVI